MRAKGPIRASVLATILLVSACTGGHHMERPTPPPGSGGTLRLVLTNLDGGVYPDGGYDSLQTNYNPALELARCCIFRTLMSYSGRPATEGGNVPMPDLAARAPTVSADRLTWTFSIRPGIHYAPPLQRVEVTSADFVRALERAWSPAPPALTKATGQKLLGGDDPLTMVDMIEGARAYADDDTSTVSGLETPDPHTLQVRLAQPRGDLDYLFATSPTAPIPPNPTDPEAVFGVAQGHDLDYGKGFQVGTGPYMLQGAPNVDFSLPPDQQVPASGAAPDSVTFVRNPSWNRSTDPLRGAYVDSIILVGAKDLDKGEQMVEQEKADMVFDFTAPSDLVERYQASPALRDRVHVTPFDTVTVLMLNVATPPLDDIHVRKALNYAIDKTALVPVFRAMTTSTPATHLATDGVEGNLLANYAPYGTGAGDLEAAHREIAQSGYDGDRDGVCDAPACGAVHVLLFRDDPVRLALAKLIRGDLRPLGIDLVLDRLSDDAWFQAASKPAPGQAILFAGFTKGPPSASTYFGPRDLYSFTSVGVSLDELRGRGYSVHTPPPTVDDRIQACSREVFEAQVKCWDEFDQYLMEEVVAWVPLLRWTGAYTVSSRVTSFSIEQSSPYPGPAPDRIALGAGQGGPASDTP
jgi:ABC-type transport system substrate-binding protein